MALVFDLCNDCIAMTSLFLQLFDIIRKDSPDALNRLVAIEGDIGKPGLGINENDAQMLTENVSTVFHLAATIQFNSCLREALQYNVLGVRELIKLAKRMKKLQVCLLLRCFHCIIFSIYTFIVFGPCVHCLL